MKLTGDYHLHTIFSGDGKSELREILEAARMKGLREVAITDHGPSHFFYGIKKANIIKLSELIEEIKDEYPEINIIQGLEANIHMDGSIDIDEDIVPYIKWVNAGYHFGSDFSKDLKMHLINFACKFLSGIFPKIEAKAIEINTNAIVTAMKKNKIDMLTHPGDKGPVDIVSIASAAEEYGVILEINSSHKNLTVEQIMKIQNFNIRFGVCSDAHCPSRVGEVQKAIDRAIESGISLNRIFNLDGEAK